jgi:soluble lytic murein transglycosylase-like protein
MSSSQDEMALVGQTIAPYADQDLAALQLVAEVSLGEEMLDFLTLAQHCAPEVHTATIAQVVRVESDFNPYAIGVVGGHLERQPRSREEALATARYLANHGYNFSVGLGQVNQANFQQYGLTLEAAFEPCLNLHAAARILQDCYRRAYRANGREQAALRDALSCYYSGDFMRGYSAGYVIRVVSPRPAGGQHTKDSAVADAPIADSESSALLF